MLKTCAVCGCEFESSYPQAKCCGEECRRKHKLQLNAQWNKAHYKPHPKPPRTSSPKKQKPPEQQRTCAHCGQQFTVTPLQWRKRFCSDKCRNAHNYPIQLERQRDYQRRKQLEAAAEKAKYIEINSRRTHLDDVAAEAKAAGQTYGQYVHSQTHPDGADAPDARQDDRPRMDTVIRLQQYCKQLRLLLTDVASGRRTVGALGDTARLKDCIVSEALQLYISGDLDRIEALINEAEKESRP